METTEPETETRAARLSTDGLTVDSPIFNRSVRPLPVGVVRATWEEVDGRLKRAIVEALKRQQWPIYLWGQQGCGKSSAAAILYRSCQFRIGRPWWIQLEAFVQQLITCRTSRSRMCEIHSDETGETFFRSEAKWFELIAGCPLLFVDDVGLRAPTEAGYEIVFKLINARIGLPTIYTSNLDEAALERTYGRRIKSRICAGTVIECTGADRRDAAAVRVKA